jgi:hypothetical protein
MPGWVIITITITGISTVAETELPAWLDPAVTPADVRPGLRAICFPKWPRAGGVLIDMRIPIRRRTV